MPIKKVVKHSQDFGSGLREMARVYMGEPKDNKGRAGKALPYFRVEFNEAHKFLEEPFVKMYGKTPDTLGPVMLIGDSPDACAPHWMDQFGAGENLVRRCDGETIIRHWSKEAGVSREPIPCVAQTTGCECKPILRMKFILPTFMQQAGAWGHFLLLTGAINSIDSIYAVLNELYAFSNGQPLHELAFEFYKEMTEIEYPKPDGKPGEMLKSNKPIVKIRPTQNTVIDMANMLINRQAALPAPGSEEEYVPPPTDEATGEIIEPAEPAEQADVWQETIGQTASYFADENEQARVIALAFDLQLPFSDWAADERIASLLVCQAILGAAKGQTWTKDTKTAAKFFAAAQKDFGNTVQQVNDGLDLVTSYEVVSLDDWRGSKSAAWGAVLYNNTPEDEFDGIKDKANRAAVLTYARHQSI